MFKLNKTDINVFVQFSVYLKIVTNSILIIIFISLNFKVYLSKILLILTQNNNNCNYKLNNT